MLLSQGETIANLKGQLDEMKRQLEQQQQAPRGDPGTNFQRALNSIPTFDASGKQSFREHEINFGAWRAAREITDVERSKIALVYSMKGRAQTQIQGFLPETEAFQKADTFKKFMDMIREVFQPASEKNLSRAEFLSYLQAPTEDVGNYLSIKFSLYEMAYPHEEQSFQTLRSHTIRGLYSNVIKRVVSRMTVATPDELRNAIYSAVASEREAYMGGYAESTNLDGLKSVTIHRGQGYQPSASGDSQVVPMEIDSLQERRGGRMQGGGGFNQRGRGDGRKETRTCHRCHRAGHIQKDCIAKTTKDGKPLAASGDKKRANEPKRGCYNCGQPGHRAAQCTSKRKARVNQLDGGLEEEDWTEDDVSEESLNAMGGAFLEAGPSRRRRM